ncbi:helix-turn-helix domain-containing protein [Streptomyces sp. NPDC002574]|uniref:helix-turn-helix domain-containing protein n=1 Tax=Streptomyces sp. NPDC002574 TaxID=3364652 RepID=UPI0036B68673
MTRWRPLADDLDPRVREFTEHLRRQVDRGGLSAAALAEATGYSRSSWERYLSARLLPPRYAVVALAQVTGADPRHLVTLWEVAERAWSRAEDRRDVTMEAGRVAEARAALGEFGPPPGSAPAPRRSRRALVLFAAGALAVVLGVVGVGLFGGGGGGTDRAGDARAPHPSRTARAAELPSGVKCTGATCTGEDPEGMGCGGAHARTTASAWIGGAYVETRYSEVCAAAWARISAAALGDTLTVGPARATGPAQRTRIGRTAAAYTPMLAAPAPSAVRACATLASGLHGCATPPGSP